MRLQPSPQLLPSHVREEWRYTAPVSSCSQKYCFSYFSVWSDFSFLEKRTWNSINITNSKKVEIFIIFDNSNRLIVLNIQGIAILTLCKLLFCCFFTCSLFVLVFPGRLLIVTSTSISRKDKCKKLLLLLLLFLGRINVRNVRNPRRTGKRRRSA